MMVFLTVSQKDLTLSNRWEDNDGCLLALDARGCRFESCFPDKKML
ncbi:hypothetical protein FLAVO9AF_30031 [Flavobacterium sp. 9AF]|nr:hypothetical protein FLAVO9AF_30031 [Flavobacterium sp. 9AF]